MLKEFMDAIRFDNVDIVRNALDRGVSANTKDSQSGYKILELASRYGSSKVFGLLLDRGADPEVSGRGSIGVKTWIA